MSEQPPPPPSSAPPTAGPEQSAAQKPGTLAGLLTVAAPGMGHVFLEVRRAQAFALLAATTAAVLLSCFVSFPIAVVVYLAAAAVGLSDLRAEIPRTPFADLGATLSWRLVAGGGFLLAVAVLLPWYRDSAGGVSVSATGRQALSVIDWLLLVIGICSVVVGAVSLSGTSLPRAAAMVVAVAGLLALALVLFRLLFTPAGLQLGVERSFGLLLAFVAAVLLAGGAAGAAASKRA